MNAVTKEENHAVVVPSATSLLQAITQAASNPQVDIEKMERLFCMHQTMVAAEAETAFNRAMALTQKKIEPVAAKAFNSHTKSYYAKLEAVNEMLVPIYTAEGLSVSFNREDCPTPGWIRTVAIVSHRDGHTRRYHNDLPLDDVGAQGTKNKTGVQATGSTIAYNRRYLVFMIFNVSTLDDMDGNRNKEEVAPDAEGKKVLEACGSIGALQKAWQGLSVDQRKTLSGVKDECKAKIDAADKAAAS